MWEEFPNSTLEACTGADDGGQPHILFAVQGFGGEEAMSGTVVLDILRGYGADFHLALRDRSGPHGPFGCQEVLGYGYSYYSLTVLAGDAEPSAAVMAHVGNETLDSDCSPEIIISLLHELFHANQWNIFVDGRPERDVHWLGGGGGGFGVVIVVMIMVMIVVMIVIMIVIMMMGRGLWLGLIVPGRRVFFGWTGQQEDG